MFFPPRRILLFTLLVFVLTTSSLHTQSWGWKNPAAGSGFIYDIEFLGGSRWIKGGEAGAMFLSTDDGTTWSQVFNPMGNRAVEDIFQLSSDILFAAGYGFLETEPVRIIKSTDSGNSWNTVYSGSHSGEKMWAFSEDVFLLLLSGGGLVRTTDGGVTFSDNIYMGASDNFNELFFVDSQTGFASGSLGYLAKTTDGGQSWNAVFADLNAGFNCLWFTDSQTGYFGSNFGRIIKTTNGGQTFSVYETGTNDLISDIVFHDNTTGYAAGMFGVVYRTTNGGLTWVKESEQASQFYDIYAVKVKSSGVAIAAEAYGNLIKRNNSSDWFFLQHTPSGSVTSIDWADSLKGFATMSTGHLLRTSDGGETWSSVIMREGIYADKVIFANQTQGTLFIGADSAFYTSNGGNTWSIFALPEGTFSIAEAYFPDNQTGYAVGLAGTVLKTTNGGASWFSLPMAQGVNLDDVFFLTPQKGFVTAYFGGTYRTTNGGSSWQLISGLEGAAISISFPTPQVGYSIGAPGYAFKTTDGGDTWSAITVPSNNHLSVEFLTEETGYAAGGTGYIYKTTNGGASWELERAGIGTLDQTVYDLDLNPDGGLWAVTAFGGILKQIESGTSPIGLSLLSPENLAANQPLKILFTWRAFSSAESYILHYSPAADFSDTVTVISATDTFYQMPDELLEFGARYYWKVRPVVSGAPLSFSDVWSFGTYNPPIHLGDVDLNSLVQAYDAGIILQSLVSALSLNKQQKRNANVTTDATISAFDASVILRFITGLVDSLPYAESSVTQAKLYTSAPEYISDSIARFTIYAHQPEDIYSLDASFLITGTGWKTESAVLTSQNSLVSSAQIEGGYALSVAGSSPLWSDLSLPLGYVYALKQSSNAADPVLSITYRFNEEAFTEYLSSGTTNNSGHSEISEFILYQNYPNPFNPSTSVRFTLPEAAGVRAEVFDILGRITDVLADSRMEAGTHTLHFRPQNAATGIYYLRITAGSIQKFIKMSYIK
jgi:photosystem II stability/assembly factor-like uncharacterized protein